MPCHTIIVHVFVHHWLQGCRKVQDPSLIIEIQGRASQILADHCIDWSKLIDRVVPFTKCKEQKGVQKVGMVMMMLITHSLSLSLEISVLQAAMES